MKKLLALLLTVMLLTVLFAACGGNPNPPAAANNPPATSEPQGVVGVDPSGQAPQHPDTKDTDESLTYITDRGTFIIGLDDTFAPMGFRDAAGNLVGFDIDLAVAVCAEMGVEPVFQPIDWGAKEMELDGKHIDCIWNGMSKTPARIESMSLTREYLNNKIILMTVPGVTISSVEDLANYQVGTQEESAALEVATEHEKFGLFEGNLHQYRSYDDCIMDMRAGRIDVMIVDEVLGLYKNSMLDEKFEVPDVDFGDDFYVVGLRKSDSALTAELQRAIDAVIANGKAAEISEKWFGMDIVIKP